MSTPVKVSDVVAEFLEKKGIRHIFGIIGSGNAHLFDSITNRGYTQIVCVHHEQAAVMAAGTYYRTTGKISAALLTTGAGSTNGVTGVVSTWMDSIPVLVISGNENSKHTVESNPLRIWGIQGYDSTAMVSKVTKYAARVLEPKAIFSELNRSYQIAGTGRPGPIWLDIPMNIQAAPVEVPKDDWMNATQAAAAASPTPDGFSGTLSKILEEVRNAKRPVLWMGQGVRFAGALEGAKQLIEALGIPTLVTWNGMDTIDSDHPLVYGRAGIYGQRAANFVLQNCDFLLTIGTRIAIPQMGYEASEFVRAARIACIDIDPLEVKKLGSKIDYPVCMDAKQFIDSALEKVLPDTRTANAYKKPDWIKQCDQFREAYPWVGPEHADRDGFMNSYRFMQEIEKQFKPEQIVVTDMGTALLSGHQVLRMKKGQRMMTSTGLGEMGFGLPGAIGAAFGSIANGGTGEVLCLNCDGGMMMNLQELQTIVHHKLPIKILVFNNDGYLMIKHTQKALFKGRYTGTDVKSGVSCPDYSKVATAFGMPSHKLRKWDELKTTFGEVQAASGPVMCEVYMHPEQLFVPKLSLVSKADGSIVSPPLEDLSPQVPRDELKRNMIVGLHPKSQE